jgi:hypothetical protein
MFSLLCLFLEMPDMFWMRVKRADTSFDETLSHRGNVAEVLARSVAEHTVKN